MGREVRRVPAGWEHPQNEGGDHIPLKDGYKKALHDWEEGAAKWKDGLVSNWQGGWVPVKPEYKDEPWEEYYGKKPDPAEYIPDFAPEERTHFQMYESVSEGTPMSPVMDTPEALARWLTDNEASAFGPMKATYEQWLVTCKQGWAISMAMDAKHGIRSGVPLNAEEL